jgi:hypothetical protein
MRRSGGGGAWLGFRVLARLCSGHCSAAAATRCSGGGEAKGRRADGEAGRRDERLDGATGAVRGRGDRAICPSSIGRRDERHDGATGAVRRLGGRADLSVFHRDPRRAAAIASLGVPYTVVRAGGVLDTPGGDAELRFEVDRPAGGAAPAPTGAVSREDLARVAVAAAVGPPPPSGCLAFTVSRGCPGFLAWLSMCPRFCGPGFFVHRSGCGSGPSVRSGVLSSRGISVGFVVQGFLCTGLVVAAARLSVVGSCAAQHFWTRLGFRV